MRDFLSALAPLLSSAAILQILLSLYFHQLIFGAADFDVNLMDKSALNRILNTHNEGKVCNYHLFAKKLEFLFLFNLRIHGILKDEDVCCDTS